MSSFKLLVDVDRVVAGETIEFLIVVEDGKIRL